MAEYSLTVLEEDHSTSSPQPALRRPVTTDETAFYYISEEKWKRLTVEAESQDKQKAKIARHDLRKFDVAGRIMEREEGVPAANPCARCIRKVSEAPCRVGKDRNEACTYCRRMGKTGCTAHKVGLISATPPRGEVEEIKQRLAKVEDVLKKQEDILEQQDRQLQEVIKELSMSGMTSRLYGTSCGRSKHTSDLIPEQSRPQAWWHSSQASF